jgi:hypothetical protein
VDPAFASAAGREKAHAIALEYSLLLTSQLEAQRAHYEGALVQVRIVD